MSFFEAFESFTVGTEIEYNGWRFVLSNFIIELSDVRLFQKIINT